MDRRCTHLKAGLDASVRHLKIALHGQDVQFCVGRLSNDLKERGSDSLALASALHSWAFTISTTASTMGAVFTNMSESFLFDFLGEGLTTRWALYATVASPLSPSEASSQGMARKEIMPRKFKVTSLDFV